MNNYTFLVLLAAAFATLALLAFFSSLLTLYNNSRIRQNTTRRLRNLEDILPRVVATIERIVGIMEEEAHRDEERRSRPPPDTESNGRNTTQGNSDLLGAHEYRRHAETRAHTRTTSQSSPPLVGVRLGTSMLDNNQSGSTHTTTGYERPSDGDRVRSRANAINHTSENSSPSYLAPSGIFSSSLSGQTRTGSETDDSGSTLVERSEDSDEEMNTTTARSLHEHLNAIEAEIHAIEDIRHATEDELRTFWSRLGEAQRAWWGAGRAGVLEVEMARHAERRVNGDEGNGSSSGNEEDLGVCDEERDGVGEWTRST
jgi:hypothetical protein